jgi:phage-related tail fiber protein
MEYKTLVTNAGAAKIAAAVQSGVPENIVQAAVGDGGGSYYTPTVYQTGLFGEMWRGLILSADIDGDNPQMMSVRFTVPSNVGGFTVREAGLFTEDNTLIAVCNLPDTKKGAYTSGAVGRLTVVMHIAFANTDALTFEIHPEIDYITQEKLDSVVSIHNADIHAHTGLQAITDAVDAHNQDPNSHPDMRTGLEELFGRIGRLEDMTLNDVSGNPFLITFGDLAGLVVTGVWNKTQMRIEF